MGGFWQSAAVLAGSGGPLTPAENLSLMAAAAAGSSKSYRRRKARTVFSDHQLQGLEKRFDGQRYLSTPERLELAAALSLSETQVCTAVNF